MVVGICSSIGILEPHAKFQQNRMGGFRDRCFEGVFYEVSFLSWGAGSGSLPTRPEEVGRCPDHPVVAKVPFASTGRYPFCESRVAVKRNLHLYNTHFKNKFLHTFFFTITDFICNCSHFCRKRDYKRSLRVTSVPACSSASLGTQVTLCF